MIETPYTTMSQSKPTASPQWYYAYLYILHQPLLLLITHHCTACDKCPLFLPEHHKEAKLDLNWKRSTLIKFYSIQDSTQYTMSVLFSGQWSFMSHSIPMSGNNFSIKVLCPSTGLTMSNIMHFNISILMTKTDMSICPILTLFKYCYVTKLARCSNTSSTFIIFTFTKIIFICKIRLSFLITAFPTLSSFPLTLLQCIIINDYVD